MRPSTTKAKEPAQQKEADVSSTIGPPARRESNVLCDRTAGYASVWRCLWLRKLRCGGGHFSPISLLDVSWSSSREKRWSKISRAVSSVIGGPRGVRRLDALVGMAGGGTPPPHVNPTCGACGCCAGRAS